MICNNRFGFGIDLRLRRFILSIFGFYLLIYGSIIKINYYLTEKENIYLILKRSFGILMSRLYRSYSIQPRSIGIKRSDKWRYTYSVDMRELVVIRLLGITRLIRLNNIGSIIQYEYILIIWFGTLGRRGRIYTTDILYIYIRRERLSLSLYMMSGFIRKSKYSTEAGLKYYIMGILASSRIRLGVRLVYVYYGSIVFDDIILRMIGNENLPLDRLERLGWEFLLIGRVIKIAGSPFHYWISDVYEGSPRVSVYYYSVLPKLGRLILRLRIIVRYYYGNTYYILDILRRLSVRSIRFGVLGSRIQSKIKIFRFYTSLAHLGWIISSFSLGSLDSVQSGIWYRLVYTRISSMIWKILDMIKIIDYTGNIRNIKYISDISKLSEENPCRAGIIMFRLISIAGIPPRLGFGSKILVLITWLDSSLYILAIFGILISVIAAYNYIRILNMIYFQISSDKKINIIFVISKEITRFRSFEFIFITCLFINPSPFMRRVHKMSRSILNY